MSTVSAMLTLLLTALVVPSTPAPSGALPPLAPRSAAQAHVQQHLDGALRLLDARDLRTLRPAQREKRAAALAMLRAYRHAGRYPQNRDFAGQRMPYFVDPVTDAHCAVGYLMAQTGHQAMVRRIAAADNHVRVLDLAGDPEVRAWLDEYGFTLEEAARIQPTYNWEPTPTPSPSPSPTPFPSPIDPIIVPMPGPIANTVENVTPLTNQTALQVSTGVSLGLFALQRLTPSLRQSAGFGALNIVLGLTGTALAIVAPESEPAAWRTSAGVASAVNAVSGIMAVQRAARLGTDGGTTVATAAPRLQWSLRPSLNARALQAQLRWSF